MGRRQVIVDNDFAGDPDGLVALAHLLLSDELDIALVTTTGVDPALAQLAGIDPATSAARGADAARRLVAQVGATVEVVAGPESFAPGARASAASRAIVEAVAGAAAVPVGILCGGPLTNVAAALEAAPTLGERAMLVWIGGSAAGAEYNRDTDADAAEEVLGSGIPVHSVPRETYERMRVSLAEITGDLAAASPLGRALADLLLDVPPFVDLRGALTLGDSALASVAVLEPPTDLSRSAIVESVDMRLLWGDFLARLRR
ncbi:nucleoside hydrolase [Microbacterium invictum]|uniref:Inosine-uridine nucleoside N-ribohydrolase n=1 Tax=Microbacterium invictum TaxID=515415 RepID=A0AA40SS58_9MICO|nr:MULTISPECIES: nucleoside hydrolase [Microbacterium]MBB4141418.1 inosine-uridine nucleoside N-ribohydrolase [Microbacterium invictum]